MSLIIDVERKYTVPYLPHLHTLSMPNMSREIPSVIMHKVEIALLSSKSLSLAVYSSEWSEAFKSPS